MAHHHHHHHHYYLASPLCNNSGCRHAPSCPSYRQHPTFSHPVENIPPVYRPDPRDLGRPPCIFFLQGCCTKGEKCPFSHNHNASENKPTEPCVYFRRGACRNGQNCTFLHDTAPVASPPFSAKDVSPRLIPLPPSPSFSVTAPVFEPCNYEKTGECSRGNLCTMLHNDPVASFTAIPSQEFEGVDDWIRFSEAASTPASPPVCRFISSGVCDLGDRCGCGQDPSPSKARAKCNYFPACARGDSCIFAHDGPERQHTKPAPDAANRRCAFQSKCRNRDNCRFLHDADESPTPAGLGTESREKRTWFQEVEENLTWGSEQPTSVEEGGNADESLWDQVASPWSEEASTPSTKQPKTRLGNGAPWSDEKVAAWGPDEQPASKWVEEDAPVASSSGQGRQYTTEPNEASWSYGTDDLGQPETREGAPEDASAAMESWNHSWPEATLANDGDWGPSGGAVPADDSWNRPWPGATPENGGSWGTSEGAVLPYDSWNRPWPEATHSNARRTKKGNCLYYGQGFCSRGNDCWFRHVQEPKPESISPEEPATSQAVPSSPIQVSGEPTFSEQSIHHCRVRFGASGIPETVASPFESETVILSNYPAGISHDDVLQLVESYGTVKDTTFRLAAGGVEARIRFADYTEASEARVGLNGMIVDGQAICAQLATVGSVKGVAHESGAQVKLVWNAPTVSGWAFYATVRQAKDESARLNGMLYGARKITAEYRKPTQKHSFPVRLDGLPPTVSRDELLSFCTGASSISLNPPNYMDSQDQNVLGCLNEFGPVTAFEVLPTLPSDSTVIAFAEFPTKEMAATALSMHKNSLSFLGPGLVSIQSQCYSKHTCTKDVLEVIRGDLDRLRDEASGCQIDCYEDPPCVYVHGRHPNAVVPVTKHVQDLVFGSDLPHWDPYFETRSAEDALTRINQQASFHIRCDKARLALRIWGDKAAGDKQLSRLLKALDAKRHRLPLSDDMLLALLNGGLQSLQDEFGETKVLFDVHLAQIIALGDSKPEIENRLSALSTDSPRGTGNCCLCLSGPDAAECFSLPCTHIYCSSCLKLVLRRVPGLEFTAPKCVAGEPGSGSVCLAPIPISVILSQLPNADREWLFERSLSELVRSSQASFRFCPRGCPIVYRVGESAGTILTCPNCALDICASCAVPAHTGLHCGEYQTLISSHNM